MTEDKFAEAQALKNKISKAREAVRLLKSGCFISLERNEIPHYCEDKGLRRILIEFFEKQIEELTTQFNKL
ncbi:MAG: hypothetical protein K2M44_03700 [Clostridia bacterium]|nr:hypothetical protein [Clostridia bacterium]